MKKRGFTLIELLIAISLISILCSIGTISFLKLKEVEYSTEEKRVKGEIISFIQECRNYCMNNEVLGKISISTETDGINFYYDGDVVKSYKGSKDVYFEKLIGSDNDLNISKYGIIDGGTFKYKFRGKECEVVVTAITSNVK